MKPYFLNIVKNAVKIRVEAGEELDAVVRSYTNLSGAEKAVIKEELLALTLK